eukprot:jgi/Astpho2/4127/Aster-01271
MDGPISRFFGVKVEPKAEAKVGMELVHGQGDDSDDEQPYICSKHLTQVALGSNPKSEKEKLAIGTLQMGVCEHFQIDYMTSQDTYYSHSGPSDVYLTGYQTMTSFESWKQQHMSPEDYEDMEFGDDDDDSSPGEPSSDDEDSEDEGDVPNGVPLLHSEASSEEGIQQAAQRHQQGMMAAAAAQAAATEDTEDEDDDEEEDSSDEDEEEGKLLAAAWRRVSPLLHSLPLRRQQGQRRRQQRLQCKVCRVRQASTDHVLAGLVGAAAESSDDEEDDYDEIGEDSDSDEDGPPRRVLSDSDDGLPTQHFDMAGDSDDEEDSEDVSDEEDESDEEGSSEDEEPAAAGVKRTAPAASTPQPVKKAKVVNGAITTAPAQGSGGGGAAQWEASLKQFLKNNGGSSKLSVLGTNCKRPDSVPKTQKLKSFLQSHPDAFEIDADAGTVRLI